MDAHPDHRRRTAALATAYFRVARVVRSMARGEFGPLSGSRQASKSRCDSSSRGGDRPATRTRAGIARSRLRYSASAGRASGLSLVVAGTGREICAELAQGECDYGVSVYGFATSAGAQGVGPCLYWGGGTSEVFATL